MAGNTVGRPSIGPRMSTFVPSDLQREIKREAKARGITAAAVMREDLQIARDKKNQKKS